MAITSSILPRWTKRAFLEGSGRDPLGLSRVSDNFTDLLLPSIITTTNRARYYSFYPWTLRESLESLGDGEGPSDFVEVFRKREAAFAIASKLGKQTDSSIVGIDQVNKYLGEISDQESVTRSSGSCLPTTGEASGSIMADACKLWGWVVGVKTASGI